MTRQRDGFWAYCGGFHLDPLDRWQVLGSRFGACTDTGATVLRSSHAAAERERVCGYLIVLGYLEGDAAALPAEALA